MTAITSATLPLIGSPVEPVAKSRSSYNVRLSSTPSIVDPITCSREEASTLSSKDILERFKPLIAEHVERRIHFLFLQLIACRKTNLDFSIGKVRHQGGSSSKISLQGKNIVCHSAHSSTIPCLEARIQNSDPIIFLEGTDYYKTQNSTISLPQVVNEVDQRIDYMGDGKLRDRTIQLIQQVSVGEITPIKGVKKFILHFISECDQLARSDASAEVRAIAADYRETGKQINQQRQKNNSAFFASLLGLNRQISKQSPERIRKIFSSHYKKIQNNLFAQAKLIRKVEQIKSRTLTNAFGRKKPTYTEGLFYAMVSETKEGAQKAILQQSLDSWSAFFDGISTPQQEGKVRNARLKMPAISPADIALLETEIANLTITAEDINLN